MSEWHGKRPLIDLNDLLKEGRRAFSEDYHERVTQTQNWYEICVVCGKRTTKDRGIGVIFGWGGAMLVHPDDRADAELNDDGYMGGFMVGPECGKKIPQEYRIDPSSWEVSRR